MVNLSNHERNPLDEYKFHGPVIAVSSTEILITPRVWKGGYPPRVGEDIKGHLWLQESLWRAD